MRAAAVRVVDKKDVTRIYVVLEAFDHRFGGKMQRSHMNGNVGAALHHGIAVCIAQAVREIAAVDHE